MPGVLQGGIGMSRPVTDFFSEFRADGWPLCPRCGLDELYSHIAQPVPDGATVLDWVQAGLTCYACQFQIQFQDGAVTAPEEAK